MDPKDVYLIEMPGHDMELLKRQIVKEMTTLFELWPMDPDTKDTTIHETVDILIDEVLDDPMSYPKELFAYFNHVHTWQLIHPLQYVITRSFLAEEVKNRMAEPHPEL